MKTLFRAAAVGALILAGTAAATGAMAQTAPTAADSAFRATTLNLSAYGETRQAPDMATITLGVTTEAPSASEAMKLNADRMTGVIASLKKAGIDPRDIQTSGLNLNPQYVYVENQPPRLNGYQAANTVTIVVRDLKRLGSVVDASVNSGATNVGGISFGIEDSQVSEDKARVEAVKALQAKANLYAQSLGYKVARLVTFSESGGYAPQPPVVYASFARAEKMDSSTPVEAGQLKVRVDVSATFELVK
ncbi:SIMPL domain-containing protein [Caulobacter sp. NIBR1757]|uniref:SIMPL domain-containing protein n=1 Tax=Caulobacter sp. NIBR1757 TaxID=3016000 RepID=UPI0022F047FA|nr:SIMPL domain-containing protein [Caulobacter sp. NIBR1757]WGM38305.1 26 kDa periplasmic immunogenic protein [Caulobacter sp. NIBR1757]